MELNSKSVHEIKQVTQYAISIKQIQNMYNMRFLLEWSFRKHIAIKDVVHHFKLSIHFAITQMPTTCLSDKSLQHSHVPLYQKQPGRGSKNGPS